MRVGLFLAQVRQFLFSIRLDSLSLSNFLLVANDKPETQPTNPYTDHCWS